jgi:hypothetical protein
MSLGIVNYGRPSVATSECLFEGLCTAVLAHFRHDIHAGLELADLKVDRCVCVCVCACVCSDKEQATTPYLGMESLTEMLCLCMWGAVC